MDGAVYHFGPRWISSEFEIWEKASGGGTRVTSGLGEPQPAANEENFTTLVASIAQLEQQVRGGDVSLEQIRRIWFPQ